MSREVFREIIEDRAVLPEFAGVGGVGTGEVVGLHAERLRLRLGFDGIVDRYRPFLLQALLGHGVREGWTIGKPCGHLPGMREYFVRADGRVVEAEALRLFAAHRPAGEKKLGRASRSDDARQDVAGAHIGSGETNPDKQESYRACGRGVAEG